jgi:hypothetical protein
MMTDIVKRLRLKPEEIEAGQVNDRTVKQLAKWCGGSWSHERDRGVDTYLELIVPNVEGNQKARDNDYVVRKEDGRFYVMKEDQLTKYEEYGKRLAPETTGLTPHYVARGKHPFGN